MFELKFCILNVNSLISMEKRHYLDELLKSKKPDIVLVSETKLNFRHKVHFNNFIFYRKDRNNGGGGGCGILIREDYESEELEMKGLQYLECCAIRLRTMDNNLITVCSIYNSYGGRSIEQDLQRLKSQLSGQIIIGGDFNARIQNFEDKSNNTSGLSLERWLHSDQIIGRLTNIPTDKPTRGESYLDRAIVSTTLHVNYSSKHPYFLETFDYESDHKGVVLKIMNQKPAFRTAEKILDYKNIDLEKFYNFINNNLLQVANNRNLSNEEIENTARGLPQIVQLAIENAVPKIALKTTGLIQLEQVTLNLIRERKQLRRRYRRTGRQEIKSLIRNADKLIKEQIAQTHKKYWENKFKSIKMKNDTFKKVKVLAGIKTKYAIPSLLSGDQEISQPEEKAEKFAEFWTGIYGQNQGLGDEETTLEVERVVQELTTVQPRLQFSDDLNSEKSSRVDIEEYEELMDVEEMNDILRSRNNKLSSGHDGIPMYILKKTPQSLRRCLVILFNNMYNNSFIPQVFKETKMVPVLKPRKNAQQIESYRPISLISNVSKLYEVFIHRKILRFMEENNICNDRQFGFKNKHSTVHALSIFSSDVTNSINRRSGTIAVSIDTEKAFDTTWQKGIAYKMKQLNFPVTLCAIILNYLENRKFKVNVNKVESNLYVIKEGVPQGSILGPTLYNIYTMDIPEPSSGVNLLMYADDVIIYGSHSRLKLAEVRINSYLNELGEYMNKWKLKANEEKCEVIKVYDNKAYKNIKKYTPKIKLNGKTLKTVKKIKYLGQYIKENFNHITHIEKVQQKTNGVLVQYYKTINEHSGLSIKVKLVLHKQVIRSVLSYAFPAWFHISKTARQKIKKFERKCLRRVTGMKRKSDSFKYYRNTVLYEAAKIEEIDKFLIKTASNFINSSEAVNNQLVQDMLNQQVNLNDRKFHIRHLKEILNNRRN